VYSSRVCLSSSILLAAIILAAGPTDAQTDEHMVRSPSPQQAQSGSPQSIGREGESDDFLFRRSQWFYRQRAYPLTHVPPGMRLQSAERLRQMLAERASELADEGRTEADLAAWVPIGPQPTNTVGGFGGGGLPIASGRVTALAVDPKDFNTVYLGGAEGGIWKTQNGGGTWIPLTDNQPSLAIGSIAIAPSDGKIIYAGTGEENFSPDDYYGAGVLYSDKAGDSWKLLPGPFPGVKGSSSCNGGGYIGSISVNAKKPAVVLAAGRRYKDADCSDTDPAVSGVYLSTNSGVTWARVIPARAAAAGGASGTAVLFDPKDEQIAYAAIGELKGDPGNGIYKNTKRGE